MASSPGGAAGSYHRNGSSTRSAVPVDHMQTILSGIQSDWDNFLPPQSSWINRNDSNKAHYAGSAANVPLKQKVNRGVGLRDSRKAHVWRAAAVELVATAGFTFLSITAYLQGGAASAATLAFLQALIYSLAIFAAAPISGGHLNPAITFTTFLTGQATLVRSLLYVVAQLLGGFLGSGAVMLLTTGEVRNKYSMGGCVLHELPLEGVAMAASALSKKQGLLAETIFTIIMLFVAYGIGFDTRSIVVTFPIISPFIIGGVLGILIFISQGLGYTAAMNPARCLGPAVIHRQDLLESLYAFIAGPLIAALVFGLFQHLVHHSNGAEVGPLLPLNFVQTITPDHQRPGFGPRGGGTSASVKIPDQDIAHSQRVVSNSLLQLPTEPSASASGKYNLVLQIKAMMQPNGLESRRTSTANIVDVTRTSDDSLMLQQQYPNSLGSSDVAIHHSGDPEKDR